MNARVADIESLVAAHRQGVFRYLCRIVGRAETAHDLTQEVFLRASRAGMPETTDTGQRAWIFRIARNLALNHVRDNRRRPEPVALVERGTAATQELQMAVREALAALPEIDRDVFLLRESVGLLVRRNRRGVRHHGPRRALPFVPGAACTARSTRRACRRSAQRRRAMDKVREDVDVAEHQERFEVIAAFADGERVDTRALRTALDDEAGRDYLIDLVAMREIVAGVVAAGADDPIASESGRSAHMRPLWPTRRAITGLAAALTMAVGLAGYAIGQQRSQVVPMAVRPPLEADVVIAVEAPPAPTQVIHLGSGVPSSGVR